MVGDLTVNIGTWESGAADKAAIQRVKVPPCQLPDFRHVVMPHLGVGNHPGDAWCKRLGRPEHSSVVGATRGSSEYGSLNIKKWLQPRKKVPSWKLHCGDHLACRTSVL